MCTCCGDVDSLAHIQRRVDIGNSPEEEAEGRAEYLAELTKRAYSENPDLPQPFVPNEEVDITFPQQAKSEEDGVPMGLPFEDETLDADCPQIAQHPGALHPGY